MNPSKTMGLDGEPFLIPVPKKRKVYVFWATWCQPKIFKPEVPITKLSYVVFKMTTR